MHLTVLVKGNDFSLHVYAWWWRGCIGWKGWKSLITSPQKGMKYYDDHVCLLVCRSVCWHISELHIRTLPKFLCMFPVAVAWFSSDGIAICYVLPALQMTSCFHTMWPVSRIKHDIMFRRVCQVLLLVGCHCKGKGEKCRSVCKQPHHYGNSRAIWDHTMLPATWQRWHSCLYPSQLKPVLNLAILEGCKAEWT